MTREEEKSCIGTIEMLQRLAYNIHGVMDVIDADNCKKIIKALEQEPCNDAISRQAAIDALTKTSGIRGDALKALYDLPPVTPQPKSEWQHDHEILKAHSDGANAVLDKIRAEIVDLGRRTMNDNRASGIWACRDIIDKYKAESEEK